MHIGRDRIEGLGYQVAYSAKIGDAALFGVVFITATILQRGGFTLPGWLMDGSVHASIGLVSFIIGVSVCNITLASRWGHVMDVYHDVVIAPMILYFAATLLPVIYLGGTTAEKISTVCLVLLWIALVAFDVKTDRMNQRRWLTERGINLLS
jgi:hypothetical protein